MFKLHHLTAREILDSRGRPTVAATCSLAGDWSGSASVPSGASTGQAEALELRDGDPQRYRGLGCRRAVAGINTTLANAFRARMFRDQADFDQSLLVLDGTLNKSRLGANALLAASLAFARAAANQLHQPLYNYFADLAAEPLRTLPRPTINLFSGGKHAGGQCALQDVLVVPISAQSIDEALAVTYEVYQTAASLCARKYNSRPLTADEGGLAPAFPSADAMLQDALESIERAGFKPGSVVALAIDVAASHFFHDGKYLLDGRSLSSNAMIEQLRHWTETYPIVSVEDGLAEDDWPHWPALKIALQERCLVVGDDLLCTNPTRIERAVAAKAADTLLLKVNQIGTLTEANEARRLARAAGWKITVSARSGETEDNWLADLAVGWAGDQIKVGSITQSERLSKYNRLLEIEAETGLPVAPWRGARRLRRSR